MAKSSNNFETGICTPLPRNFAARSDFRAAFTVLEALRYLGALPQDCLAASLVHCKKALIQIETPRQQVVAFLVSIEVQR